MSLPDPPSSTSGPPPPSRTSSPPEPASHSSAGPPVSTGPSSPLIAGTLAIAWGATIENAIGGAGDDRLVALAALVNRLVGGARADFLDARDAGPAADKLECGDGADTHRSDAVDVKTACETAAPG